MISLALTIFLFCPTFAVHNDEELVFVQVIYRHGDRNIIAAYPNDPWKDEKYWPGGYGELTALGKLQHYELGKFFRRRYRSLLGNGEYSRDKVYIQSTDSDRTIMSAAANLAGLFPLKKRNMWTEEMNWQPIPIHSKPDRLDYFVANCSHFNILQKNYMESSARKAWNDKHRLLLTYLTFHSGMPLKTPRDVAVLYDTLKVQSMRNMTLPEWTKYVFYNGSDFEHFSIDVLRTYSRTPEMSRLKAGFYIQEILQRFKEKSESKLNPDRTLWFYSSHDIVMTGILDSLELYDMTFPPYASALMFELYKSKGNHFLKIFFRKSDTEVISPLNIPGCGPRCPLDTFNSIYSGIIPTGDLKEECMNN